MPYTKCRDMEENVGPDLRLARAGLLEHCFSNFSVHVLASGVLVKMQVLLGAGGSCL
jgi:hypothetical protein